jgi:hypothetical protein
MAAERRLLHDDEACALKVADNALGGDSRHVLVGMMDALATFELQSEGNSIGEVARVCGSQLIGRAGYCRTIAR